VLIAVAAREPAISFGNPDTGMGPPSATPANAETFPASINWSLLMRLRTVLLSLSLLAVADLAHASADGAWAALRAKSDKACVRAASDLRDTRVVAYGDAFQDVTVSTLEGRLRARGPRGQRVTMTCVYDKRSGQAQALELQAR
jgi:hypothetical protein